MGDTAGVRGGRSKRTEALVALPLFHGEPGKEIIAARFSPMGRERRGGHHTLAFTPPRADDDTLWLHRLDQTVSHRSTINTVTHAAI